MNWLNLGMIFLDDEPFAGAEAVDRGTWVSLLKYCAKVENGGRITGAALWKTRKSERILGVSEEETHREAAGLWEIDGEDIVVLGYPADQEAKVKAKRLNGKLGGRPAVAAKPPGKPPGKPHGKGNGRKGKGIEKEPTATTRGEEFGIHPDDSDEYGPAPNSEHPGPDPLWSEFLLHRDTFERFDAFRDRIEPTGTPANN